MADSFYVYLHRKADSNEIFYVGKGKGQRSHTRHNRTKYWRHVVEKHGLTVEIVKTWNDEADALAHEIRLIAEYRLAGLKLVNLTDGGEGASGQVFSDERKRKISASQIGKTISPEVRAKISASLKGKRRAPRTEEHRRNISLASKGKVISEEQIKKSVETRRRNGSYTCPEHVKAIISKLNTGRHVSAETRKKLSEINKGNTYSLGVKRSEETRRRMSLAQAGRVMSEAAREKNRLGALKRKPISDETRRLMSEAHKRAWAIRKSKPNLDE